MSKIKVLTVQFDVTHLPKHAIDALEAAAIAQAEGFGYSYDDEISGTGEEYNADVFNSGVKEIDVEDT